MKFLSACAFLILGINLGLAQERLPLEEAQKYAKILTEKAAQLNDLPIKIEVDADKPLAVKGDGGGAMVIPDKNLSEKTFAQLGKEIRPVGQLWFHKYVPVSKGKAVPLEQLRIVTITLDDNDHPLPLFLLGVRKKGENQELVVFGKGQKPLLTMPLQREKRRQDLPLELDEKKGENDTIVLVLNVLGEYRAQLAIARQD